ncbi:MAG TPA: hypothetical protein VGK22_02555 [Candidatus Angelobacter sp.]|jgi:hypothetical protein
MNNWNEELQRVLAEVVQRSVIDPEFRTLALRNAFSAILVINPRALQKDINFKFVDHSGSIKAIPLDCDSDELSEDELEKVAGGDTPPPPPPITGG